VLLDEIGELPLPLQAKLLRVIETHEVMRVGAVKPRTIDVRFLAATNRVLEDEVARGAFRQDLYYRLNGISLLIPPLRARLDEIEPLARSFVENAAKLAERPVPRLSPAAVKLLLAVRVAGETSASCATRSSAQYLLSDGDDDQPRGSAAGEDARTPVSMERVPETAARPAQAFAVTGLDEQSRSTTSGSSRACRCAAATRRAPRSCWACRGGRSARASRPTTSPAQRVNGNS
jgi:hypothetical protein